MAPDLPVLLMSGVGLADLHMPNSGAGIAGHLQKPFSFDQLLDEVRRLLRPPE